MPKKRTLLEKYFEWASSVIGSLENARISLPMLLAWATFIGLTRIVLETLVFADTPFLSTQLVVYHFSWFAAVALSLSILFYLLAGTPVLKALRLVCFSLPVILVSVLVDGLVLGQRFSYEYVEGPISFIGNSFLSFLWNVPYLGIGFKIEIALLLLGVFLYFYVKNRRMLPAFAAFLLVYVVLFFFGTNPMDLINPLLGKSFLLEKLFHFFFESNLSVFSYQAVGYLLISAALCFAWLFLYSRKKFFALLSNIRVERVLVFSLAVIGGFVLGKGLYLFDLAAAMAAIFFAWNYGVAVNDLSDVELDKKTNKGRPLVKKIISREEMTNVAIVSALFSLGLAFSLGFIPFCLILLGLASTTFYSLEPFRLKRFPLSVFFSALGVFIGILLGYYAAFPLALNLFVLKFSLAALLLCTLGFNVKDVKDFKADKSAGIKTIPVLLGERVGRHVIALMVLFSYLVFPLLVGIPLLLAPSIVFGAASYPLIVRKSFSEKPVIALYVLYVVLMIAGYFFFPGLVPFQL